MEIRNLKVTAIRPGAFAGYKAITAAASRSDDGTKAYIVVFNKHHEQSCTVKINVKGLKAGAAKYWCVTGPSFSSTNVASEMIKETVSGASVVVKDGALQLSLPSGSMTAIEVPLPQK
jgi:alpha-L-arabinofuranosidase